MAYMKDVKRIANLLRMPVLERISEKLATKEAVLS